MANDNQGTSTGSRGFGSMDEDKQREIASKGGKAAHQKGTAHEFTPDEAKEAGRKGGQARQQQDTGALDETPASDLSDMADLNGDLDR